VAGARNLIQLDL